MAKKEKSVLTIRIDNDLDDIINEICERNNITKASLIRNYLELIRYVLVDKNSILSLNNNELLLLKKSVFKTIIDRFSEESQIDLGIELAQFINDLSRLEGKLDNIEFKLDLCEHYGFFQKFIDKENYILITNKFGPKKFIEAFIYKLINMGSKKDFDKDWTEEKIESSKKYKDAYNNNVEPVQRSADYYSFEFAKINPEE